MYSQGGFFAGWGYMLGVRERGNMIFIARRSAKVYSHYPQ